MKICPPILAAGFFAHIAQTLPDMPDILKQQIAAARHPRPSKCPAFDSKDFGQQLDIEKAWHGVHFLLCGVPMRPRHLWGMQFLAAPRLVLTWATGPLGTWSRTRLGPSPTRCRLFHLPPLRGASMPLDCRNPEYIQAVGLKTTRSGSRMPILSSATSISTQRRRGLLSCSTSHESVPWVGESSNEGFNLTGNRMSALRSRGAFVTVACRLSPA